MKQFVVWLWDTGLGCEKASNDYVPTSNHSDTFSQYILFYLLHDLTVLFLTIKYVECRGETGAQYKTITYIINMYMCNYISILTMTNV